MAESAFSNFESETANHFLEDLIINGYGLIRISLDTVLDESQLPGVIACEEALLSAEIIAAACGKAAHDFPDDLLEWMNMNIEQGSIEHSEILGFREKAADAIDRIVTESELRELWEESPSFDEWFNAQVALQNRILD